MGGNVKWLRSRPDYWQRPLAHVPESQSQGAVHALPFAGLAQQPFVQWFPSPQSLGYVQGLPTSSG